MTFQELKQTTSYWLDDLNFGYFTDTQVGIWLNNAQKRIQKRLIKAGKNYYDRCVQTTLVVNQNDYALPSDFKDLVRLEVIVGGTAPNESKKPVSKITTNQQDLIGMGTGTPAWYFFKRNRLVLLPAPDSAIALRMIYAYEVPDMVLATDTPDAPDSYHEYIALLAAEDGFIKDGRTPVLLEKKIKEFEVQLDEDAAKRNLDSPRMIVETGWDSTSGFIY